MPTTTMPHARYQWAATGVSGYPLTHPIVGQTRFFDTFRHFIHLVDEEHERFAHVFAVVAQWGVGKSRLAYELIAQINGSSRGWYVRDESAELHKADLFYDDADREQYLGLYIRYSQIAVEYHNVDNWFGYGLYKALLPLARAEFDGSIQGEVAREAYDRLLVLGFDEKKLAQALEVEKAHSDEQLYLDENLVTRLCQNAYDYLSKFGIKYLLIALDELETAGEASTYGLETEDIKRLDGRAIKLIGKAIKEEDPRRKLPWLRYVALCSPAIGDELRDIQSTARRFEMVELAANTFSDVSDFVRTLREQGRLQVDYPSGLVEAAYAMSAGNFGWFNVIMANVDEVLQKPYTRGERPITVGDIFAEALRGSSRMREYVLDHQAVQELKLERKYVPAARELLYGQLPVPLDAWPEEQRRALLAAHNEFDEPVAMLFQRVEWDEQAAAQSLRAAKFVRDKGVWLLGGVDQPLDLRQLLANLGTYAIHAGGGTQSRGGKHVLLLPLRIQDFVELVAMLYPHPAAEDAARALWRGQVGSDEVEATQASHFGPSIAMVGRLDLRYRKQSHNALIFREPDKSTAHELAMAARKGRSDEDRALLVLTGAMRALDENWEYDPVGARLKDVPAIVTAPARGRGQGGLLRLEALMLHPDRRLILAWVRNHQELERLCDRAAEQWSDEGRTPVIAFTSSVGLMDQFNHPSSEKLRNARSFLLLHQLSAGEEFVLQQVGLPSAEYGGFKLSPQLFTTAFANRLQTLVRPLKEAIHRWRRDLDAMGRIAWPLRSAGPLKDADRDTLLRGWRHLMVEGPEPRPLVKLDERSGIKVEELLSVLGKTGITPKARAAGYAETERAGLFSTLDEAAEPRFPIFLCGLLEWLLDDPERRQWSLAVARKEWFWGYLWEGAREAETFQQWMALICQLGFARESSGARSKTDKTYQLVSLKEWQGRSQEAWNWLRQDYPKAVARMEEVFGSGKVNEFFGPLDSGRVGTKTRQAQANVQGADATLQALVIEESNRQRNQAPDERVRVLEDCTRKRFEVSERIGAVYDSRYQTLAPDENIRVLEFEDNTLPLWERIGRARHFADYVLKARERINRRLEVIQEEMRQSASSLPGFPVQLFVRSLHKVHDILEGSFTLAKPEGSTQRRQQTEPDTLGQYLQDLDVARANDKLARLAHEAGVVLNADRDLPLEEIDGQIVRGFLDLKKGYEQEQQRLDDLERRIQALDTALAGAPADFRYPPSAPPLEELREQPGHVRGELEESLAEDVEGLLAEHDRAAKLGNFQPLMLAARNLLHGPRTALGVLAGHVHTLELVAANYRRRLLEAEDLRHIEAAFNALLRGQGQPARRPLELPELEKACSLRAAARLLEDRRTGWAGEGAAALAETGVTFAQWQEVVQRIGVGQDPDLTTEQADRLVARGLLRRTYTLGGPRG
jgi:hypothetical protein